MPKYVLITYGIYVGRIAEVLGETWRGDYRVRILNRVYGVMIQKLWTVELDVRDIQAIAHDIVAVSRAI